MTNQHCHPVFSTFSSPAKSDGESGHVVVDPDEADERLEVEAEHGGHLLLGVELESVQLSHFGSRFAVWHFNLQIEMLNRVQMRKTVIPYLKPIFYTSKLKIAM